MPNGRGLSRCFRTGSQWVHLPEQYGSWKGVYTRLRNWAIDGTWERVFTAGLPDDEQPAPVRADRAPGRVSRTDHTARGGPVGSHAVSHPHRSAHRGPRCVQRRHQ
ncbi:transposase [Streptomyces diastatochromogenes]|uniref:transposase n=1 Tax=Streptomyces diastatochromogenes TaxID=42236 RepID=UPI003658EEB5